MNKQEKAKFRKKLVEELSAMNQNQTNELVISRKGYRKIFTTVVVGGIVAHFSIAVMDGVYGYIHTLSKKNNGLLWRTEQRMNADIKEKAREAQDAVNDRDAHA